MKRITKIIALLMSMVMILSGCMTQVDEFTINSDGSARMVETITYDKAQTDTTLSSFGYTDPSVLFAEMTGTDVDYKVITGDDGKEYYQLVIDTTYKSLKEMALDSSGSFTNGLYVTKDTMYGVTAMESIDEYKEMGYDPSTIGTYTMQVTFSKPIVNTNGKIDAENPNKVVFNLPLDKASTIFVTTATGVSLESVKKKVKASNTVKKPVIKSIKVKKIKGKKATVQIKLSKVKGAKYFIEYATNKGFSKNWNIKTSKKTTVTLKGLKKGKKYYFRVYAWKENYAGLEVSSGYSKRKSLKMVKKTKKAKKK